MSLKITLDFDKPTMSKGTIDVLSNGLQDDPGKDVIQLSLKECLVKLAKGNKLPYKAANYLLVNILKAITLEGSDASEEIRPDTWPDSQADQEDRPQEGSEDTSSQDKEGTIHGSPEGASTSEAVKSSQSQLGNSSQGRNSGNKTNKQTSSAQQSVLTQNTNTNRKQDTCRFYARGHCNRGKECRFDHPSICTKFRKFGSKSTDQKGCDGKCNAFHPNACRSSLKDRTCSFNECRFFHLKGTKRLTPNQNQSIAPNQNWRKASKPATQGYRPHSQNNENNSPKNWPTSSNKKKKKPLSQEPNAGRPQTTQDNRVDNQQLGRTLEAIMERLAAMEARQPMYHHHPVHPLLSPAVPQPGTQQQFQWRGLNQ